MAGFFLIVFLPLTISHCLSPFLPLLSLYSCPSVFLPLSLPHSRSISLFLSLLSLSLSLSLDRSISFFIYLSISFSLSHFLILSASLLSPSISHSPPFLSPYLHLSLRSCLCTVTLFPSQLILVETKVC